MKCKECRDYNLCLHEANVHDQIFDPEYDNALCFKPMTNADHIRAMSDEELAASPIICRAICNLIYDRGESKKYCLKDEPCSSCIRNWLKAPYKENEE